MFHNIRWTNKRRWRKAAVRRMIGFRISPLALWSVAERASLPSLHDDLSAGDDTLVERGFLRNALGHLRGAATDRADAKTRQHIFHLVRLQNDVGFPIQKLDSGGSSPGGCGKPGPRRQIQTRIAEFRGRRYVRQQGGSTVSRRKQSGDALLPYLRCGRRDHFEEQIHLSGHDVVHRRSAATVGDVRELYSDER